MTAVNTSGANASAGKDDKRARLAEALRDNLRRRKAAQAGKHEAKDPLQ